MIAENAFSIPGFVLILEGGQTMAQFYLLSIVSAVLTGIVLSSGYLAGVRPWPWVDRSAKAVLSYRVPLSLGRNGGVPAALPVSRRRDPVSLPPWYD